MPSPYSFEEKAVADAAALRKKLAMTKVLPKNTDYGYGKRQDGTNKAQGFLGELKRPDGNISTEISAGVTLDGKNIDIPLLVPGLSKEHLDYLINTDPSSKTFFKDMPSGIMDIAVSHAKMRMEQGKSVFATEEDKPQGNK